MNSRAYSLQRIFFLSLFFVSCKATCPHWIIEKVNTEPSCFSSVRLTSPIDEGSRQMELEFIQSKRALRMYLNVFSLEINPENPIQNTVTVHTKFGEQERTFQAFIYRGGQRLLIPKDASQWIIENLLTGNTLSISVGRYQSEINPYDFASKYPMLTKGQPQ